jgi:hypothetical protein
VKFASAFTHIKLTDSPELIACGNPQPARSPAAGQSVVTRSAFLIWQPALQNFLQQATWNCTLYIKFFGQPEDALTTQLNSSSRRPDCNSRNLDSAGSPEKLSARYVHAYLKDARKRVGAEVRLNFHIARFPEQNHRLREPLMNASHAGTHP